MPMNEDVTAGYLHNVSTLPLNSSLGTGDSISELKRDLRANSSMDYEGLASNGLGVGHYEASPVTPVSEPVPEYFGAHGAHGAHGATLPHPHHHHHHYYYEDRPRSEALLETNLDEDRPLRSKSEAILETNFDAFAPNEPTELTQLSTAARSKSQPLETAM
jgi:hypothetical protein